MVAETISLGIFSLPYTLKTIGLIPGIIVIACFGLLATYTGYGYGQFAVKHPNVTNVGDAACILFGRWGKEIVGASAALVLVFIMAAHITSFAIAMNELTHHGTCSITFMVVGTVISILCTIPRRLNEVAILSVVCKFLRAITIS